MKYFIATKRGYCDTLVCGNEERIKEIKSHLISGMKWNRITKKEFDNNVSKMEYPLGCRLNDVNVSGEE